MLILTLGLAAAVPTGPCAAVATCPPSTQGTDLARRILAGPDGTVRFAYAPREDVCGDGRGMIRFRDDETTFSDNGSDGWSYGRGWRNRRCVDGPVRIAITVRNGRIDRSRVYVGGDWPSSDRDVRDFGMVGVSEAADALLDLARRGTGRGVDDLVFPALLADSVTVWRPMLALARDGEAPKSSRKSAIFWLSQEAGEAVAGNIGEIAEDASEDREVRESAVFALSQLPREEGVPILIRVARSNRDPEIRRKALFWLGQSEDPRALALFEEILTRPD